MTFQHFPTPCLCRCPPDKDDPRSPSCFSGGRTWPLCSTEPEEHGETWRQHGYGAWLIDLQVGCWSASHKHRYRMIQDKYGFCPPPKQGCLILKVANLMILMWTQWHPICGPHGICYGLHEWGCLCSLQGWGHSFLRICENQWVDPLFVLFGVIQQTKMEKRQGEQDMIYK